MGERRLVFGVSSCCLTEWWFDVIIFLLKFFHFSVHFLVSLLINLVFFGDLLINFVHLTVNLLDEFESLLVIWLERTQRGYCLHRFLALMFGDLFLFAHLLFGFLLLVKLLLQIHDHFCLLSLELNHFLDVLMNRRLFAHFTWFQCILRLHADVLKTVFRGWDAPLVNTFAQPKIDRFFFILIRCLIYPLFLIFQKRPLMIQKVSGILMVGITRFGLICGI